jgi:hypothetical protein
MQYTVRSSKGTKVPGIGLIRHSVTKGRFTQVMGLDDDQPASSKMTLNIIIKPDGEFPYEFASAIWDEQTIASPDDLSEPSGVVLRFRRKTHQQTKAEIHEQGYISRLEPYNPQTNKRGEVRFQDNPVWTALHYQLRSIRDTYVIVTDWSIEPNGDLTVQALFGQGQLVTVAAEEPPVGVVEISARQPDADIARLVRIAANNNVQVRLVA